MNYIVIEIQKYADGTIAVPPINTYATFNEAAQRYHTILAAAAVSSVPVHSAVMMTDTGIQVRLDTFDHTTDAAE